MTKEKQIKEITGKLWQLPKEQLEYFHELIMTNGLGKAPKTNFNDFSSRPVKFLLNKGVKPFKDLDKCSNCNNDRVFNSYRCNDCQMKYENKWEVGEKWN